jgi:phosphatidylserine synthase
MLYARARAYSVHLLTASGVVAAFLTVAELLDEAPDYPAFYATLSIFIDPQRS